MQITRRGPINTEESARILRAWQQSESFFFPGGTTLWTVESFTFSWDNGPIYEAVLRDAGFVAELREATKREISSALGVPKKILSDKRRY